MAFVVTIDTDNAAFLDNPDELAELLEHAAKQIRGGRGAGTLRDSNGNTVGRFGHQ